MHATAGAVELKELVVVLKNAEKKKIKRSKLALQKATSEKITPKVGDLCFAKIRGFVRPFDIRHCG